MHVKRLALFSVMMGLMIGCGETEPMTPAEYFNATQADTNTPYGNVRDGSAVDNPDGSITIETDNGDRLTVPVQQTEAGPKYGTPTRTVKRDRTNR